MTIPMITITLTPEEANRLELATGEIPYLLSNAAGAFATLHSGYAGGFLGGDNGAACILDLCARAFRAAAEQEGEAIGMLDRKLRKAISVRAEWVREQDLLAQEERTQQVAGMQAFADQWAKQGHRNPDEKPGTMPKSKATEPEGSVS